MRNIALVTTSRADYGIQSRLIRKLQKDEEVNFSLIVTGMHCSRRYGYTVQEIEDDGISIWRRIDAGLDRTDSQVEIMACVMTGLSKALKELSPDIVVILGDRFEMMAVSIVCTVLNIPLAHLHGGEATWGLNDEVFRHSMTKASHVHFAACEEYRRRIIQLGEDPARVFNFGALGVENIKNVALLTKAKLEEDLGVRFLRRIALVTFHPVTLQPGQEQNQMNELLGVLGQLDDTSIIFTRPNADAGNGMIREGIDQFVKRHPCAYAFDSLGVTRYFSLVGVADVVIGNSSSGIIEVPSFHVPTVNIGARQAGRVQARSVINCAPEREEIQHAISKAFSQGFRKEIENLPNPYEGKNTADEIVRVLKTVPLEGILEKRFNDLEFVERRGI